MDLKLDENGDLDITGGDFNLVDGIEAIAQNILIRLRFFQGEWFLDIRVGIPYWDSILIKNPDLNVIRSLIREAILTTPGVLELNKLDLVYDEVNRSLSIDLQAISTTGEVIDLEKEFVIV